MPKPDVLIILSPGFPKDESDTTCMPPKQLFVKMLNKVYPSIKIVIISFTYPFTTKKYLWNGNEVFPFNGLGISKLQRAFHWLRIYKKLRQLKNENNIIGLLSFWCGETAFIGKWFGKINFIKHYCWISGQDAKKGNPYIKLIRPAGKNLIAISDFIQDEFYKNYSIKPQNVVPNGIDKSLYRHLKPERDIEILGAGSLIPLKQYDIFIDVIKSLKLYYPSINAVICGKGHEEKKLKNKITVHQLSDNIQLEGEKQHPEVLHFMQRSKIFLHTSNYEGFGAVCIEALYAGCHVISFVQPMKQEIPHWHYVKNQEEMIEKCLDILNSNETQYFPVEPFLIEDSVKKIMQLFI